MKRVAIFQTDLNVGGIQKSLINLLNNIDYEEYEIDLYLFNQDNIYTKDISKKVNIKYLKPMNYLTRVISFNILKTFYRNKINKKYDIAIDYNSYSMDTSLACIKCNASKKIIWVHNDIKVKLQNEFKYKILYFFFKTKYKYFNSYVGVSKEALKSFKELNNFDKKEYIVIPNIIDTKEIIIKSKEKIDIKFSDNVYNLCSLGRLCYQKGFDLLIEDIRKLKKFRTDFHLYIIGDGEEKIKLNKMIKDYNLKDYITLLGFKENPYVYLSHMDGFILESRYEGQGMVFLEAKTLGLDIIMPKHLEKYVEHISGSSDIVSDLKKLTKHEKKYDNLSEYNNEIIKRITKLFNE